MASPRDLREVFRLVRQWTPESDGSEIVAALERAGVRVADILPDVYALNPDAALVLRQWVQ